MFKNKLSEVPNTSTPKRRRLGTSSVIRSLSGNSRILSYFEDAGQCSTQNSQQATDGSCSISPPLPSNQMEYLRESSSEMISPFLTIPENSTAETVNPEMWATPILPSALKSPLMSATAKRRSIIQQEVDNISVDMFQSKLELNHVESQDNINVDLNDCSFKQSIVNAFDHINQSLFELDSKKECSVLFETKDSFLLNVATAECINNYDIVRKNQIEKKLNYVNPGIPVNKCKDNDFYGLPLMAKTLFKMYRNIDKFYDWQEECLNLEAIRNRRNLIYALPTSGGKTLVAEVLMLREVLNNHKNALFILPFVAIVQEKIWSLSPFAIQLDFLVEEYAAGKGNLPPKKCRKKNSIYVATIEKGLALVRSLIELNRLNELGLIVVDELHLVGEAGRGGTLETLLSTVIFANQGIQIVGMSATIGNLPEIAQFLRAELYQGDFRPVQLTEYVKLGDTLHHFSWTDDGLDLLEDRKITFEGQPVSSTRDPDGVSILVGEVVPGDSCLVFCATKRACENLAALLTGFLPQEMLDHRVSERTTLVQALVAEGSSGLLLRAVRSGVAYHHAGLATDERKLLEDAFRSGTISVLCCTSTLAAGVNLPARRVILRSPYVGRELVTLAAYRQMAGRAGRAGLTTAGESVIMCCEREWAAVRAVLCGGLSPAVSGLCAGGRGGLRALVLSAAALKLADTRRTLRKMLACTLLYVQSERLGVNMNEVCDEAIRELITSGVLQPSTKAGAEDSYVRGDTWMVYNDTVLTVTRLGNAAIKGCMDVSAAKRLCGDLETASRGLVLQGALHLLYVVTPNDVAAIGIRPDYRNYYNLYMNLDEEGLRVAKVIGITENNAVRMMTGKPITSIPDSVLQRYYAALMLRDLWREATVAAVADKYMVSRGTVQALMSSSAASASCATKFCEEVPLLWSFRALLAELAVRLQHCAAPHLQQLMELPAVRKARALQLYRAGYRRLEDVGRASPATLCADIPHLSTAAATHLISTARLLLIEKVENLRAEAEDVMEELNIY